MPSMRDIKRRKESITSTGQITKAMKLVSTVKLQKSKSQAENGKPYFRHLYSTIDSMLADASDHVKNKYLIGNPEGKTAIIVISSNRGLAGGYNNNVVKAVMSSGIDKENVLVYAIGSKAKEALARRGYEIADDRSDVMNAPLYADATDLAEELMRGYEDGTLKEICIVYTFFKNTVVHDPEVLRLLPTDTLAAKVEETGGNTIPKTDSSYGPMNFEPTPSEVLKEIMPKYLAGEIYGALIEALASENAARMTAMDNATSNAEDMISNLELQYNRARQGAITQELTEIIAGANAIN
ncbi:MAG: ATP synthase F1 subunit gamma [Lachnospiraceae bacterium]|nr:ATP synthase F1 subunit gamma [Lachnospiraceae bacterium]